MLLASLAGGAWTELQIAAQSLSFTVASTSSHRIAYAIIEEPENSMTGLFFPVEAPNTFHAEIGKLLMDWTGTQSATLVLAFECGDVDCDCSPLILDGEIRLSTEALQGQ